MFIIPEKGCKLCVLVLTIQTTITSLFVTPHYFEFAAQLGAFAPKWLDLAWHKLLSATSTQTNKKMATNGANQVMDFNAKQQQFLLLLNKVVEVTKTPNDHPTVEELRKYVLNELGPHQKSQTSLFVKDLNPIVAFMDSLLNVGKFSEEQT